MRCLAFALFAFLAYPDAAAACSPLPAELQPTRAQLNQSLRDRFRRAEAVVEVVAETASTYQSPGRMRVVRAYKGSLRPGSPLYVLGLPGSVCGPGNFARGFRGTIIIDRLRPPLAFPHPLSAEDIQALRRARLMPAR